MLMRIWKDGFEWQFLQCLGSLWYIHHNLSHLMTKPTKVRSESSLSAWRKLGSLSTHSVHSQDWSDWAEDQADPIVCWAHSHFVGFVMKRLIFFFYIRHLKNWGNHPKTEQCGFKLYLCFQVMQMNWQPVKTDQEQSDRSLYRLPRSACPINYRIIKMTVVAL